MSTVVESGKESSEIKLRDSESKKTSDKQSSAEDSCNQLLKIVGASGSDDDGYRENVDSTTDAEDDNEPQKILQAEHSHSQTTNNRVSENEDNNRLASGSESESSESPARDRRTMLLQYAKELICILALVLTTYAALQNESPKIGHPPVAGPFFKKGSLVQDWPNGQLSIVQTRVSMSEISLVFFYAPWCADSQHARSAYDAVAKLYNKKVYFSAVNCWQPGGECRLQYAKVLVWPVLMAYFPQGIAVQYHGSWTAPTLSNFIEGLLKPYHRVTDPSELLTLLIDHDAVAVGFFRSLEQQNKQFQIFVQSAIKWLEKDPFGEVKFVAITGSSVESFGVKETPTFRMYLWNETLEYDAKRKWTPENLTKWTADRLHVVSLWLSPPGRKSHTLSQFMKDTPSLLFFTPRDHYSQNKDAYHMLKQVALEYYNCKNDTWIEQIASSYIQSHRTDRKNGLSMLEAKCNSLNKGGNKRLFRTMPSGSSSCTLDTRSRHVSFAYFLNNSNDFDNEKGNSEDSYCYIGPKLPKSLKVVECKPHSDESKKSETSMINSDQDIRGPKNLLQEQTRSDCKRLKLSELNFGKFFENEEFQSDPEATGLACKRNHTLSFLLLDSIYYDVFTKRLGINIYKAPKRSAVVILDNINDSTYQLNGKISPSSLRNFVKDFHSGGLTRRLRVEKSNYSRLKIQKRSQISHSKIQIRELNSSGFLEYAESGNKTTLVLFYSTQCALCSIFSHSLLSVAKILETLDIDFFRIDGDKNDLMWHYTMEKYPTLVIFPFNRTSETRTFPESLAVTIPNILGFLMANVNSTERLFVMVESCKHTTNASANVHFRNCIIVLNREIKRLISINLHFWRIVYPNKQRTEVILKRIVLLHDLNFRLEFQVKHHCDLDEVRKDIDRLARVWTIPI